MKRKDTSPCITRGILSSNSAQNAPVPREASPKRPGSAFRTLMSGTLSLVGKAILVMLTLFLACSAFPAQAETSRDASPKMLVAYFSLSGNTRLIASDIQKMTGGELFEIRPVHAYGPDFDSTVAQARRELAAKARPPLKELVSDIQSYDVVFVGFPNWVGTMPMPVFSFLEQHDFSGKTIVPFCTHGTSGPSNTFRDLAALPLHAVILEGLAVYRNDVPHAEARVREWLHNLGYLKKETL